MFELTVETSFAAAHCLKGYPSPCGRLHGHNWTVAVTVAGERLNDAGMLVDFKVLKEAVRDVVGELDHQYLNELPFFRTGAEPTAENIARYIYTAVAARFSAYPDIQVREIKVAESPAAWVVYRP
ncbi:MAG TPA: 6-carboxytetrahydropterin synthase QueD [Desulfotomaculum sp.]|nr:6-carboxytetrahydropterin synthase QueD [Desulfotomaculum sp.]